MENIRNVTIMLCALALSLGLCLAIKAWTEPNGAVTPPGGTVATPLNTGGADQIKTGRLNIGTGLKYWISNISGSFTLANKDNITKFIVKQNGNVGIGTTDPAGQLDIEGGNMCINGDCCPSWQQCFSNFSGSGNWRNGSCEAGTCPLKQRQQYVTCITPGCIPSFTQCVNDATCQQAATCTANQTSGCAKCNSKGTVWENTCASGKACNKTTSSCSIAQSYGTTDCTVIKGWACNPSTPNDPLQLKFYMDEISNPGGYLGVALANGESAAPATVAAACGGTSAHLFEFKMPKNSFAASWPVNNGLPHKIYVYGNQSGDGSGVYILPTISLACSAQ